MSSPFSIMRRYQKVMLAIFGVICMIVFVIGDAIGTATRFFTGDGSDPTIVQWNGGKLSGRELDILWLKHRVTLRFLSDIAQRTKDKKGQPKVPGYQEASFRGPMVPGIAPAQSDEDLVARVLLAQKAEETGIVVSDDSVKDFLTRLSDNLLAAGDWEDILQEILGGGSKVHLTQQQVKEHLRLELAAQSMMRLEQRGLVATSPVSAWEFYNRFHLRRKLEFLPLKVEDYASQITTEPTDSETKALYEKYKDTYPFPSSPEPGFKQRRRVAFQYLMADFEDFVKAAMPSVTEEAITREYELATSRGEYKVLELPPAEDGTKPGDKPPGDESKPEGDDPESKTPAAEDKKPDDKKPDDKKPADEQPGDAPADAKKKVGEPAPAAPKSGDGQPAEKNPADKKPADSDSPPAKEAAKQPGDCDEPAAQEDPAAPAAKPAEEPAAAKKPESTAPDDKPAADKKDPADDKPAAEKPNTEKPSTDKPEEKTAPEDKKDTDENPPAETKAKEKVELKFKPLADVRDDIIRRLAKEPAEQERKKALEDARREVEKYSRLYKEWESEPEDKRKNKPEVDVKALAERFKLKPGETPPVDALEIEQYEIGKTSTLSLAGGSIAKYSFAQIAFQNEVQPYRPERIRNDNDVEFLYWKTEQRPEFVPTLETVRGQVVRAWKQLEAIRLAQKDAERKAEEARSQESLKAAFGDQVMETPEFSWLSRGVSGFGAPQLSEIDGIQFPGPAFMEKAFSLKEGDVGVTENHPQTFVFVIRILSEFPKQSLLREQFLTSGLTETRNLARQESLQDAQAWYVDLTKELNVDWKRAPRSLGGGE